MGQLAQKLKKPKKEDNEEDRNSRDKPVDKMFINICFEE